LNEASIMYFQKDSVESDVLCPQESEQYTWDDLSLPRKLVVRIVGKFLTPNSIQLLLLLHHVLCWWLLLITKPLKKLH